MIGWKNEKQDEIQMYAQPIDEPTEQMEPSLACYELLLDWQTFLPSGKGARKKLWSLLPAQVSAEQRGRTRWEKRQERGVELKGSLAC